MRRYPAPTMERAIKVQEVILQAASGQVSWWQAAEILGISDQSMRRWRECHTTEGYAGVFNRRRHRLARQAGADESTKAAPCRASRPPLHQ
jgi:transposase-like protein